MSCLKSPNRREIDDISPASLKVIKATAGLFAGIALLAGLAAYSIPWGKSESIFVPEHAELLGMTETSSQRAAHQAVLLALFVASLAGMVLLKRNTWPDSVPLRTARLFAESYAWWALPMAGAIFLLMARQAGFLNVLTVLAIWLFLWNIAWRSRAGPVRFAFWVLVLAAPLCMMLPGLLGTPDLRTGGLGLRNVEWHYSIMPMCSDRLAEGERLIKDVRVYYGPLVPMAIAIMQRATGMFSFGDHVRVVQFFQLAFLFVFVGALFLMRPRHPIQVLVPLLMVLPWIHNNHIANYFPNQSGWRSLGLPVGVMLMLLAGEGIGGWTVFAYGVAAGALVFFNPETGLCLTLGILVFIFGGMRSSKLGATAGRLAPFPFGFSFSLIAFMLVFRLGLGTWPFDSPRDFFMLSPLMLNIPYGYGGLPLQADLAAFFIFAHVSYVFLCQAFIWSKRPLNVRERTVAGVAATMLLWFGFYMNRPAGWNLWTYLVLYAFLIFDGLSPQALESSWKRMRKAKMPLGAILFVMMLGPGVLSRFAEACCAIKNHERIYFGEFSQEELVSGVLLPEATARELAKKSDLVNRLAGGTHARGSGKDLVYFTVNSFLMPKLSGIPAGVPFGSVFAETFTRKSYDELVALTLKRDPAVILFDDPDSPLAGLPPERSFYARLRKDLSHRYIRTGLMDGWEIWERKSGKKPNVPVMKL